ncbi:hypothetical protein [Micromonospora sp. DPT]|uniref:hypothetical protein n=1 Tax=Micromonospora sp. DPT TaxID=3142975 RepID=UPI003207C94E
MAWVEKRGTTFRVRLRMPDGTVTTDSTHERRADATIRAKEIDVEVARDTFIDPRGGRIPLSDWVPIWEQTHQASPATWAAYRSHLRLHIMPTLGPLPLVDIRRQHILVAPSCGPIPSDGMRLVCLNSAQASSAVGVCIGLLPQALVLVIAGWGPTGNDNVGEWYVTLAFMAACPALVSVLVAVVLVRTRLRAVGVGMLGAVGALSLLWVIGVSA